MEINKRSLEKSEELWQTAQDTILSGCQLYSKGPETDIKGVSPIYIDHGKGAHVWDPDGNEYIDYDMGLGPILLGYQYKAVDDAVRAQLQRGMGYSLGGSRICKTLRETYPERGEGALPQDRLFRD